MLHLCIHSSSATELLADNAKKLYLIHDQGTRNVLHLEPVFFLHYIINDNYIQNVQKQGAHYTPSFLNYAMLQCLQIIITVSCFPQCHYAIGSLRFHNHAISQLHNVVHHILLSYNVDWNINCAVKPLFSGKHGTRGCMSITKS